LLITPVVTFRCAAKTAWLTAALVRMRRMAAGGELQDGREAGVIEFPHGFAVDGADLVQVRHAFFGS
jgi:hypothetical protein